MRSNCKEVKEKIREHIGEYYTNEELKKEVENLKNCNVAYNIYGIGKYMVQCGNFLVYYDDVREFLNTLDLNNSNKNFTDEQVWEMYQHLLAREIEKIVKE